jgi:phosphomannomutase
MTSRFGTDGVRARFGEEPLTERSVVAFGYALA